MLADVHVFGERSACLRRVMRKYVKEGDTFSRSYWERIPFGMAVCFGSWGILACQSILSRFPALPRPSWLSSPMDRRIRGCRWGKFSAFCLQAGAVGHFLLPPARLRCTAGKRKSDCTVNRQSRRGRPINCCELPTKLQRFAGRWCHWRSPATLTSILPFRFVRQFQSPYLFLQH